MRQRVRRDACHENYKKKKKKKTKQSAELKCGLEELIPTT
jgi:hypothetical protein